ncbi:MAG: hypothetical protein ABI811_21905 [Acidobacteriota bacterium]
MPRRNLINLAAVLLSLMFSFALLAQWPAFPTPGAPKLADGQPDVNGPAPVTADGKPDFSGVWSDGSPGEPGGEKGKGKGPGGPGGPGGKDKGPPPDGKQGKGKGPDGKGKGPPPLAAGGIPPGGFLNMGASMPGGLPYQESALKLRDQRLARNSADHPDAHCLPLNPVQLWFHPQPRKLIQTTREIVLLAEANSGTRQIFTDGRALPNKDDVQPWWYGYSVGKWDGDTLVVESTGFLDEGWIDEQGSPLSNAAKVTERIRRPNYGTLQIEITVNDPKTYTKPWTVTANQRLMADDELIEFVCGENNTGLRHLVAK